MVPYLEPKADGRHGIEDSCPGRGAGGRETPTGQTRAPPRPPPSAPGEDELGVLSDGLAPLLLPRPPTQNDAFAQSEVFLGPGTP